MKKFLSVLLSVVMLLALIPSAAFAVDTWNAASASITCSNVDANGKVTATIDVTTSEMVKTVGIGLSYDSDLLDIDDSYVLENGKQKVPGLLFAGDYEGITSSFQYNANKRNASGGEKVIFFTDANDWGFSENGFSVTYYFKVKQSVLDAGEGGEVVFKIDDQAFLLSDGENDAPYPTANFEASAQIPMTKITLTGSLATPAKGARDTSDLAVANNKALVNVTWDPALSDGTFAANTAYTATVTVSPLLGGSFAGDARVVYEGLTFTRNGNNFVATKTFDKTLAKELTAIEITTPATKLGGYAEGDTFDAAGMVVKATYDDNSVDANFTGYTLKYASGTAFAKGDTALTLEAGSQSAPITLSSPVGGKLTEDRFTFGETAFTYDGTKKAPAVTTTLAEGTDYEVSYQDAAGAAVTEPITAGSYTLVLTGKGEYAGTVTKSFTIAKADQTLTAKDASFKVNQTLALTDLVEGAQTGLTAVVTGNAYGVTVSDGKLVAPAQWTGGDSQAVSVKVEVTAAADDNYNQAKTTVNVTLTNKDTVADEQFNAPDVTVVYDGKAHAVEAKMTDSALTAALKYVYASESGLELTEAPKDAGEYVVTVIYEDATHYGVKTVHLTITPRTAELVWSSGLDNSSWEKSYDGKEVAVTAAVSNLVEGDQCAVTLDADKFTDAGAYTIKATVLDNPNYALPENATHALTVNKADRELKIMNGDSPVTEINLTPTQCKVPLTFTMSNKDDSVNSSTIEIEDAGLTLRDIAFAGEKGTVYVSAFYNGSFDVEFGFAETDNYKEAKVEFTVNSAIDPIQSITSNLNTVSAESVVQVPDEDVVVEKGTILVTGYANQDIELTYNGEETITLKYVDESYSLPDQPIVVEGVTYGFNIDDLTALPSEVSKVEVAEPKVLESSDAIDAGLADAAEKSAGTLKSPDLDDVAAQLAADKNSELAGEIDKLELSDGEKVEIEVSMSIQPTAYDPDEKSITFDIKPQYQLAVVDGEGNQVEGKSTEKKDLKFNEDGSENIRFITVSVKLPFVVGENMRALVKHYLKDGGYEWPLSLLGEDKQTVEIFATSFSKFEIYAVEPIHVSYSGEDTVDHITEANVGKYQFDQISATGTGTFTGWSMTENSTLAEFLYNSTMTQAQFDKLSEAAEASEDRTVTLYPVYRSNSGGGSAGGGGGGGGGSSSTVTKSTTTNGSYTLSSSTAKVGDTVKITPKANAGYEVDQVTATDKKGDAVAVTKNADGTYSFVMPASTLQPVKTSVTFKKAESATAPAPADGGNSGTQTAPAFADVAAGSYYEEAVKWAAENGVTNGTDATHFSPMTGCTRAQFVTFLWRAAGSPEPTISNSFSDVSEAQASYLKAILWAVEQGIANGVAEGAFAPSQIVSRAQAVTFMCRYAQGEGSSTSHFTDVPDGAYYTVAVDWAEKTGVTTGTGADTFGPTESCTRAQMVTFLYRLFNK